MPSSSIHLPLPNFSADTRAPSACGRKRWRQCSGWRPACCSSANSGGREEDEKGHPRSPNLSQTLLIERYGNGTTKRYVIDSESQLQTVLEEHAPTEDRLQNGDSGSQIVWFPNSIKNFILPAGFPGSVSEDYLDYMLLQFPTNVTGWICHTLVTSSLIKAVGVGTFTGTTAAASAAAIRWVSKDGLGAVGRLFIGGKFGNIFDDDPKKWRMYADFIGSAGSIFKLATPLYPAYFLPLASLGNLAKAVARGFKDPSFRVIQNHFAASGNLGEVAAKINLKRARLLVKSHVQNSLIPGYAECNKEENILSWERLSKPRILYGIPMEDMFEGDSSCFTLKELLKLYAREKHILVARQHQLTGELEVYVTFKVGATSLSVLRSLWQSYWLVEHWKGSNVKFAKLEESLLMLEEKFSEFLRLLEEGEWDTSQINLKVPKDLAIELG